MREINYLQCISSCSFYASSMKIYRQEISKQNLLPTHKQTYIHQIIQFDIRSGPRNMTGARRHKVGLWTWYLKKLPAFIGKPNFRKKNYRIDNYKKKTPSPGISKRESAFFALNYTGVPLHPDRGNIWPGCNTKTALVNKHI